jgi:hypothetical protein
MFLSCTSDEVDYSSLTTTGSDITLIKDLCLTSVMPFIHANWMIAIGW